MDAAIVELVVGIVMVVAIGTAIACVVIAVFLIWMQDREIRAQRKRIKAWHREVGQQIEQGTKIAKGRTEL